MRSSIMNAGLSSFGIVTDYMAGGGGWVSAERALVFFNNRPTLEVITKSK